METPLTLARRATVEAFGLWQVARSGMLGIEPPRRTAGMLLAMRHYGTLGGGLTIAALRNGDRVALCDELGELSFNELERRSNALANEWRTRGIAEGTAIAILCRNHRGFLDATFAAAKIGARAIYLNTDFAGPQTREVCAREGVEALVHDEEFSAVVEGVESKRGRFLGWVDEGGDDAPRLEDIVSGGDPSAPPPPAERSKVILLTSGTTGTPKGAPRTQPRSPSILGGMFSKIPFRAREATYVAPPMFHALGFAHMVIGIGLGSKVVTKRRFVPEEALAAMAEHRTSALIVVPVQLARILALGEEELERHDLSSLRIVFCGGSQLEGDLVRRALDALGPTIYNLYGSTEVAWATIATPEDLRAAPGCAGRPPFGTTVQLYDEAGEPVDGPNQVGRIFVGNSSPFEGYTGGGTKEVIDGLMSSGDVGHWDEDGRLFIDGRDDDMIVSGGENVFPVEIEELLTDHPSIREAAVLGVPDEDFGERLRAYVALAPDAAITEDEVKAYVKENLARFKVPRDVVFIDELPRNPTGKVLKRELLASG